jgi:hypothetical protein
MPHFLLLPDPTGLGEGSWPWEELVEGALLSSLGGQ